MKYNHSSNTSLSLNELDSKTLADGSPSGMKVNHESISIPSLSSVPLWPLSSSSSSSSSYSPSFITYLTLSHTEKLIYRKEYPPELWLPYEPCFWPEGLLSNKNEKKGPLHWWYLPEPLFSQFTHTYSALSNSFKKSSSFSHHKLNSSFRLNHSNFNLQNTNHESYFTTLLEEYHSHRIPIPNSIHHHTLHNPKEEDTFLLPFHPHHRIDCCHDDWVPCFSLTEHSNDEEQMSLLLKRLAQLHPNQNKKSNLFAILSMFYLGYGLPQDLNQALNLHVFENPKSLSSSFQSMSSKPLDHFNVSSTLTLQSNQILPPSSSTTTTTSSPSSSSRPLTSTYIAKRMIGHALGKTIVTKKDKEKHMALVEKVKMESFNPENPSSI